MDTDTETHRKENTMERHRHSRKASHVKIGQGLERDVYKSRDVAGCQPA